MRILGAVLAMAMLAVACADEPEADPCVETAESRAGCDAYAAADPLILPARWTASSECALGKPRRLTADGAEETRPSTHDCGFSDGWMCCP